MSYCFNCGNEIKESIKFCPACGTKVILPKKEEKEATECEKMQENVATTELVATEEKTENNEENTEKTTQDEVFSKEKVSLKKSIQSMVFGALSADFAICTAIPFIFWMLLIPCLIFRSISKKKYNEYIAEGGESNGFMKASHAMRRGAGIALIPCLIFSVLYTVVIIALIIEANYHV